MMKRLLSLSLFVGCMVFAQLASAQTIAWFNPAKVLNNSKEGKKVLAKQKALQDQFEAERKKAEKPLEAEKDAIETEWKNLQSNANVLNEKEKARRFEAIKTKYDAWMEKVKKGQADLVKRQQDMAKEFQNVAEPFSKKLKVVAENLAKSKGYAFIIAHDPTNPQVLLFAKPEMEITTALIAALDAGR
ncbi:MAG: hypothetical protein CVU59_04760 [Deltaproteobacteria bacterium HGW-Deltaproteobacteria-17]|nr:MAG: hypothetical protein CVU59_04760 [Deltaproteobacteria bacterium HGW-Deltaproteobacteria-17]